MRQQRRTVGGLKKSHTKRQKQRPMHTLPQKTPNPMLPSRQNPAQSSAYRQHLLIRSSSHMKRCQSNTIYRRLTAIYHEKALHHHLRNTNARLLKPSRNHSSRTSARIHMPVIRYKPGRHHTSGRIKVILISSQIAPADSRGSTSLKIIPTCIVIKIPTARRHRSGLGVVVLQTTILVAS